MSAATLPIPLAVQPRSQWRRMLRQMLRSPLSVFGLVIVALMLICSIFAPILAPYDPLKGDLIIRPPSVTHPFGTDDIGRDILSRTLYGAQISLKIAVLAEALGVAIGIVVGLVTGHYGGWLEAVLMRFVDIFMAFPLLIVAIALVAALGPGENNIFFALALTIWPFVARLVRGQVLSVRESEYVTAARVIGVSNVGIMFRHILPNILTPIIVIATLGIANVIMQEATLSFLGLGGADRATPSWGRMLADSLSYLMSAPWLAFYPGLFILIAVLGFNLLGDGLRDALDVRSTQ